MSLEEVRQAPFMESFVKLSEFQAETPSTFFGERPVLHFKSSSQLVITSNDLEANPILQHLRKDSEFEWTDDLNPATETAPRERAIPNVQVWVLST
jgi:chloride channel, nucleotide-sensitive, 1A